MTQQHQTDAHHPADAPFALVGTPDEHHPGGSLEAALMDEPGTRHLLEPAPPVRAHAALPPLPTFAGPWPEVRHSDWLPGMVRVWSPPFEQSVRAMRRLRYHGKMGVFRGDSGTGKTYAVEQLYNHHVGPKGWIELPNRSVKPKQLLESVLGELTGATPTGSERQLLRFAEEVIGSSRRGLLVIDEAQALNADGVETLRHIHDRNRTGWTFVFSGGQGLWATISAYPMLRSRIEEVVSFTRWTFEDAEQAMRGFHPIWLHAEPGTVALVHEVLQDVDGRALFRDWAKMTRRLLEEALRLGYRAVTPDLVDMARATGDRSLGEDR